MEKNKIAIVTCVLNFLFCAPSYANKCVDHLRAHLSNDHQVLTLANCQITDRDVPQIVAFLSNNFAVHSIDFTGNNIGAEGARELGTMPQIENYIFTNDPIGDEGVVNLTNDRNISQFTAVNSHIGDKGAVALAGEELTLLNVNQNNITSDGIRALSLINSLQFLYVASNKFDQQGAKALGNFARNLSVLDVSNDNLGDDGLQLLATPTQKYQKLWINNDGITSRGIFYLTHNITSLTELYARNNQIKADGAYLLANNGHWHILDLSNNQIGDQGLKALAGNYFTYLGLDGNHITDKGLSYGFYCYQSPISTLQTFSLQNNKIDDAGVKELVDEAASCAPTSFAFILNGNEAITDTGAGYLSTMTYYLRELGLARTGITDAGVKEIIAADGLQSINLNNTAVGDNSASALASLSYLTHLSMEHDHVGDVGATALAGSSLKQLDISYNVIGTEGAQKLRADTRLVSLNLKGNPGA